MEESKTVTRTRRVRKPKKSQIPYAIILTAIIIGIGYWLKQFGDMMPVYWGFGIAFGYVLQRSRFCFTAGFRDPILTGSTSLTRAVLVAVGIGTIGFAAIKFQNAMFGDGSLLGAGVNSIGIPLFVGGIMFGIGMVIAGGCASGTFMRVGEGFMMQMVSLVFFIIGSLWGAHDMGAFWSQFNENAPKIFLPDVFGWFGALVIQLLLILVVYIIAVLWQKKKIGSIE